MIPEDYWEGARCREVGSEIFFPDQESGSSDFVGAVKVCSKCEIKQKCLDYALADPTLVGIWGGVGWKRRQIMRRKKKWN